MNVIERIRFAMPMRRLARHEDYLVREYVQLIRDERKTLREEARWLRRAGFSPEGRYVFGRVVAGVLFAALLVGGGMWVWSSPDAAAFEHRVAESIKSVGTARENVSQRR